MYFKAKTIVGLSCAALLGSCTTAPAQVTRTADAQQELDKALAGRVAGKPVSCIPTYRADDMKIIDDYTLLFKDGSTIYLQQPHGGCSGIAAHRNVLISRPMPSNQLCSGDIQSLFDPVSRIGGGACVFSDFVPYTKQSG
jgi:hypothetical protein